MASTACCAAGPPVSMDYKRKGSIVTVCLLTGVKAYVVGSGERTIVVIYDIFGFDYPQVFQVCDRLADAGFSVIAPDVFHGKTWPMSKFPPPPEEMQGWIEWMTVTNSVAKLKPTIMKCVKHMKKHGTKSFGTVGFCWGTFVAWQLAAEEADLFSGVAGCHPSLFKQEAEIAAKLPCPACVLSTKDDPLEAIQEVLDTKPFGPKCFYKRYDDQVHGFMAARGDWEVPSVAAAATECINHLITFFKLNL